MPKWFGNRFGESAAAENGSDSSVYNIFDHAFAKFHGGYADSIEASGGVVSTPGDGKRYHQFYNPDTQTQAGTSDTFTISTGAASVNIMVVGGGASGGHSNEGHGGGGGGGMVDFPADAPENVALTPGNYPIVIGAGGNSGPGSDSRFSGHPVGTLTGKGGGRYGPGGCGGGGRGDNAAFGQATQPNQPGVSGNYGHGYPSGNGVGPEQGEGGGGTAQAGGSSSQNGYGGDGRKPPWLPTAFGDSGKFGGGGGAGVRSPGPPGGPGGDGGGSPGKRQQNSQPATQRTGGGCGGASEGYNPGVGGSGIVIVAYPYAA